MQFAKAVIVAVLNPQLIYYKDGAMRKFVTEQFVTHTYIQWNWQAAKEGKISSQPRT